ncbi:hypothetical protein BJY04DRAFT_213568 [Aspergillus karnatakaensis]|uniref:uncharacterized protein n=1 Tax=Aspergillus karnatakaensis TaxID=1810916 RepID=UPI003CCE03CF
MSSSSTPNLQVRLQPPSIPPSFTPPLSLTIHLTIHNPSTTTPTTLLNWGSPLDPKAGILGVFEVRDVETNEPVLLDEIKFGRKLPPAREDFVEIPAGGEVTAEVTIPRAPLEQGKRYTIRAKGWWQAVWESALGDVPEGDLDRLTGALRGDFESEQVPIEIGQA